MLAGPHALDGRKYGKYRKPSFSVCLDSDSWVVLVNFVLVLFLGGTSYVYHVTMMKFYPEENKNQQKKECCSYDTSSWRLE